MLKVEEIEFTDSSKRGYTISQHQLERFPLIGGEAANMVTTKVWNQHGNTFINAFMEEHEGELVFTLYEKNLTSDEIEEQRRTLIDICNPLNGTVTMRVTLNSGNVYNRDITFVSAPIFPIGHENRNPVFQRVQLLYEVNNPFWYSDSEIVETFLGVEPLFHLPVDSRGRYDGTNINLNGKITGSNVENPNSMSWRTTTALAKPSEFTPEPSQSLYNLVYDYDWKTIRHSTTSAGFIPQLLFRFNTIEALERKYGTSIWNGATTLAEKITIAKSLILSYKYRMWATGEAPSGAKWIQTRWRSDTQEWLGAYAYTNSEINSEKFIISSATENNIDDLGFSYTMVYTDAATSTAISAVKVDFAQLTLELDFKEHIKPFYLGNVIENKFAFNNGQVKAPVKIRITGACQNPQITNLNTGEFIKFKNLVMDSDDELIIDTTFGEKKVELNGVSVFNTLDFSSTFFNLEIGENEIEFTDELPAKSAIISFVYRTLYITI